MTGLAALIGTLGAGVVMVCIVAVFVQALAMPFMAFSVVRNIARMRRALEQIAGMPDASSRAASGSILRT